MKKRERRTKFIKPCLQGFTMVEITMAVAIIGIGMAGVMALLPVGFNATRDAIGENYSSNMAEQFLHVMAQQCKMYDGNGSSVDGWGEWITDNPASDNVAIIAITETKPTDTELTNVAKKTTGGAMFGGCADTNEDAAGIYFDNNDVPGAFYVESKSGDITDFSGVMAVWKEQIIINESGDKIPYTHGVRLNLEISWPPGKPYAVREKRTYVLELFNPNDR